MSRVARIPITVPAGVDVSVQGAELVVSGPRGSLSQRINPLVRVDIGSGEVRVFAMGSSREANAMSGTYRALIANMVTGVSVGFVRKLSLVGVGYKAQAQAQGLQLNLSLGFSHPVVYDLPSGVKAETPTATEILISGTCRQRVGQVAAEVRAHRPPEPYKGKGVRYSDERVVIKETKKK